MKKSTFVLKDMFWGMNIIWTILALILVIFGILFLLFPWFVVLVAPDPTTHFGGYIISIVFLVIGLVWLIGWPMYSLQKFYPEFERIYQKVRAIAEEYCDEISGLPGTEFPPPFRKDLSKELRKINLEVFEEHNLEYVEERHIVRKKS